MLTGNAIPEVICSGGKCVNFVDSEVLFCNDGATCNDPTPLPKDPLFVSKGFWVIHRITEDAFKTWKMRFDKLSFVSDLAGTSFDVTPLSSDNSVAGRIIYELKVPFTLQ